MGKKDGVDKGTESDGRKARFYLGWQSELTPEEEGRGREERREGKEAEGRRRREGEGGKEEGEEGGGSQATIRGESVLGREGQGLVPEASIAGV